MEIYVGGECIYSFGTIDKKKIGHTPGSVLVFADIPDNCEGKIIEIRGTSPYKNYATYLTDMSIGDRDVLILQGLNIFDFMEMAFVSHYLFAMVVVVVLPNEFKKAMERKHIDFEFAGILAMAICGVFDLFRCYLFKVGDLGKLEFRIVY